MTDCIIDPSAEEPLSGIYAQRISSLSRRDAWSYCLELTSLIKNHDRMEFNSVLKTNQLLKIIQTASRDLYAAIEREFQPNRPNASIRGINRIINSIENYAIRCASRATPFALCSNIYINLDNKCHDTTTDSGSHLLFAAFQNSVPSDSSPRIDQDYWLFTNQLITRLSEEVYEFPIPWTVSQKSPQRNQQYLTILLNDAHRKILKLADRGIIAKILIKEVAEAYNKTTTKVANTVFKLIQLGALIQTENPKFTLRDLSPKVVTATTIKELETQDTDLTTVMCRIASAPNWRHNEEIADTVKTAITLFSSTVPSPTSRSYERWVAKFAEHYGFDTIVNAQTVFNPISGIGTIQHNIDDALTKNEGITTLISKLIDAHSWDTLHPKDHFYMLSIDKVRQTLLSHNQHSTYSHINNTDRPYDLMFEIYPHSSLGTLLFPTTIGPTDPGALLGRFSPLLNSGEISRIWSYKHSSSSEIVELRPIFSTKNVNSWALNLTRFTGIYLRWYQILTTLKLYHFLSYHYIFQKMVCISLIISIISRLQSLHLVW